MGTPTLMTYKVCEFWPKTKLWLLNIPADSRYCVILTGISKCLKDLSTLLKQVEHYKKF